MDEDIREGHQGQQLKTIETDLRQFLHCLTSQDLNIIKQTEEYLRQIERKDGFYAELMNIFYDRSNDVNVRFMAVIYFKTSFEKYWRENKHNLKTDSRVISREEKSYIVQKILSDFDEPVQQLGIQLAMVIDKILRLEHSNVRHVEAIYTSVLENVRSENLSVRYQALSTFHQIVKTMKQNSFLRQNQMETFVQTEQVMKTLIATCDSHLQAFFASLAGEVQNVQLLKRNVEIALLCLLIMHNALYRVKNLQPLVNDPNAFSNLIMHYTKAAAEGRRSLMTRDLHFEEIDTLIISGTKLMTLIPQKMSAEEIAVYIPKILDFAYYYCFTDEGQALVFEKFNINCLLMLKCAFDPADQPSKCTLPVRVRCSRNREKKDSLNVLKSAYFTSEKRREACIKLITHYLVLTPAELEQIDYLAFNDIGDAWKYSMRACVQHVFSSLFHDFIDDFSTTLIELVETQCQPISTDDLSAILLKDAIYSAIGLSTLDLYEQVNFEQWLKTSLIHELKLTGQNSKILRRRIYWLIGEWIGVKCNQEMKDQLYRLIVEGIVTDPDMGVRLAACFALQSGLQDFYFHFMSFANNSHASFTGIFQLLQDVDDCDIKLRILSVLTDFADRMVHESMPEDTGFLAYLSYLWHKYNDHHMLRCAVITLTSYIIKWMKSKSYVLHSFAIGVISTSCDMNQEGHIYYLEDCLDLWLSMLIYTSTPTREIMDLLHNMPMLIDRSADNLEICLEIINASILMNPEEFTNRFARVLFEALASIISDLKNIGVSGIMEILYTYLMAQPTAPQLLEIVSPLMRKAFELIIAGPNHDVYVSSVRKCVLVSARFLLISQAGFEQTISEVAQRRESTVEIVFETIISQWMEYMDHMGPNQDRKLMSLAFCYLLSPNSPPFVFLNFLRITKIILDTLEDNDFEEVSAVLEFDLNLEGSTEFGNEHERRVSIFEQNDFVNRSSLKNALWTQLMTLKQTYGESQFEQLINSDVRRLLEAYSTSELKQ